MCNSRSGFSLIPEHLFKFWRCVNREEGRGFVSSLFANLAAFNPAGQRPLLLFLIAEPFPPQYIYRLFVF